MNRPFSITLGVATLSLVIALPTLLKAAAVYNAPNGITAVATMPGGEVYIRFAGLPNPGPCGINNGWVVIPPAANPAVKSLAESLYFNRRAIRVDTAGCLGTYERVIALYSPGG